MRFSWSLDTPLKSAAVAFICSLLLASAAVQTFPRVIPVLEELSGDWIWRLTAGGEERRVVLVDIDEISLREIGPWPWPRDRLAQLSARLAEAGAALQIWDIVFASPAPGDDRLAARLDSDQAVLAQVFALDQHATAASGQPAHPLPWAACPTNIPRSHGYLSNPSVYARIPTGHITPLIAADGVVRHQPALICHDNKAYPALFLAALDKVLAPGEIQLQEGSGLLAPAAWLTGPSLGANGIPLDAQGNVRIPWTLAPAAFASVAARDILAGKVPPDLFDNAWVVVGGTALGLNDRVATPLDANVAGFVVHAQLLVGALDNRLPVEPARAGFIAGLCAVLGVLSVVSLGHLRRSPVVLIPVAGLVLAALLLVAKALLLRYASLWFPWVGSAAFIVLYATCYSLIEHARNQREKERLYRHLSSYLPGPVAAVLARKDPSDKIDAERATVTALFADIRNFSAYCERRPPDEATAVLHAFFSMATRVVEHHGGAIEAFQGDAVLAVWGAPGAVASRANGQNVSHAENALAAARAILAESHAILPQNPPDDLSPLAVGIGLETGLATVGSFGLARRRTHLAIGRTVTTAARLQEMTVELAHPILLGEGIAAVLGSHRLESQGVFLLEGLKIPCHVYAQPLRDCP